MKKYLFGMMALAVVALFTACDQDNEAEIYSLSGQGLAFLNSDMGSIEVEPSDANFTVDIVRGNSSGAYTGKVGSVTATIDGTQVNYADYCTIGDFSFADGESTTTFNVNVDKLPVGSKLTLVMALTDTENMAPTSGTDKVTVTVNKKIVWKSAGTGHYDSPEWWEEDFDVDIVYAEGFSPKLYKIIGLFETGYDIEFTITDDNKVMVPKQGSWKHSSYGVVSLVGNADGNATGYAGPYDPATKKATFTLKHTVSAGSFGTYTDVLTMP